MMDFKYNVDNIDDMYRSRYGMVVLAKSGNRIDCMYVLFKLDFKLAAYKRSILWGLFEWTSSSNFSKNVNDASFRNFFRKKALEAFYNQGIIDSFQIVESLENAK